MMKRIGRWLIIASLLSCSDSHAGMTVYGLRDVHRMRLEEISFFIFLLLLCSLLLRLFWNYATKGFTFLPRLGFLQSLSLSVLFGMLMLLILTMISGIREVLTPNAWRKQGTAYRLNDPAQEPVRRRSMEHLRGALFEYAKRHDGKFPKSDFESEISEKLWESPDQLGTRYIYRGGLTMNDTQDVLVIEPLNFGDQRYVLFVSGELKQKSSTEIVTLLSKQP